MGFYFSDDFTDEDLKDVVAFLNSMTLDDWLRGEVEEDYDDADTFIFIV